MLGGVETPGVASQQWPCVSVSGEMLSLDNYQVSTATKVFSWRSTALAFIFAKEGSIHPQPMAMPTACTAIKSDTSTTTPWLYNKTSIDFSGLSNQSNRYILLKIDELAVHMLCDSVTYLTGVQTLTREFLRLWELSINLLTNIFYRHEQTIK